jgi:thiol-disulfide isomerase/thioredoxin
MKRRGVLFGGVAAAAAVAGAGVAWHRTRPSQAALGAALWTMHFDQPGGGRLDMSALRGRPLLLNFWATWCPPCVSELPLLDRFHRDQASAGWRVAGLAVDNLAPVQEFLARRPVSYPIGLAGASGIELARLLGNNTGALPFTAVFDRGGALVQHKLGVIEPPNLQQWVAEIG